MATDTRILIADDHTLYRRHLSSLLEAEPGLEVVGEAADGRVALRLGLELEPDLLLMDVAMSELDGVEVTRRIVAALPEIKVIALSLHHEPAFVQAMLAAGASAYLFKDAPLGELLLAIHSVASGGAFTASETP